jgi:hypothetical protein
MQRSRDGTICNMHPPHAGFTRRQATAPVLRSRVWCLLWPLCAHCRHPCWRPRLHPAAEDGRCVDSEETSKRLRATGVPRASALLEGHDREVSKSLVALRRRNTAIQDGRVVMSRPLAAASISLGATLQLTLHSVERQLQRDIRSVDNRSKSRL